MTKQKRYIPFAAFFILVIWSFPFSGEMATSVVPGWHTTIFPPYYLATIIVLLVLWIVTIGYWILARKAEKISLWVFMIHLLLTIPVFFYHHPATLFQSFGGDIENAEIIVQIVDGFYVLFLIGIVVFGWYFVKVRYLKKGV